MKNNTQRVQALLTHLTFKNSHIWFDLEKDELETRLREYKDKRVGILYPSKEFNSTPLTSEMELDCLFILDGTWRKAIRVLKETPSLYDLNFYHLPTPKQSINEMRKSPRPDYLSTFESTLYALEILDNQNYSKSLESLKKINQLYSEFIRPEI